MVACQKQQLFLMRGYVALNVGLVSNEKAYE